ncbi:MAG: 5-bromo-4-chloroindolyl phosphate hydrolysis family protein [Pseudomonadota bacterium]|nr:5-bromo-4-chloroindolyl phosphate hydrolysis family protein [Pseudomonadota bacterium]
MAQRYGGKYSPDGSDHPTPAAKNPFDGQTRSRAGGRVNFLFLAPLPLAVSAFFLDPAGLAVRLVAFGLLILAAWLTREGVLAHEAYDARKIARRPAAPRKILGSITTGLGLALAGFMGGGVMNAVIFGVLGAALHIMAFGPDPMKNKGMEGVDEFQTDRVARAVGEAEKLLAAMKDAILRARDRELERRVDSFQATARHMFRTIEDDPRDLTAARKYLTVYLMGARDATVKFADLYGQSRNAEARVDYIRLLDDLEAGFTARTQKMLTDDKADLNIEIEVLRERLAREGVVSS